MKFLFDCWEKLSRAIKANRILLLSDFDGTLVPIAPRPDIATLPPDTREVLQAVARHPDFTLGIISGRALPEIRNMVGISGIYYAGNHGLEIEGPGLSFIHPVARAAAKEIKGLVGQMKARLGDIEGVFIEDKGLSASIHYRLVAPDKIESLSRIFIDVVSPLQKEGKIMITYGKKVWEIRPPVDWRKGNAMQAISKAMGRNPGSRPIVNIFLGDDETDEDAFRMLRSPEGWGVFVGPENHASSAEFFLNSPADVIAFLRRLLEVKSEG